jgi:hypothetical protein
MVKEKVFLAPTENSKIYTETYAKLSGYDDVEWLDNCMENMTGRLTSAIDKDVHVVAKKQRLVVFPLTPRRI